MSHYQKRKEERIIPTSTKVLAASEVLTDTDSYVLVNGPSSSGEGSPGFTTQTDSVSFQGSPDEAEWGSSAQVGVLNNITMSVWLKPTGAALTTASRMMHIWQLGNSSNEFYLVQRGDVSGDPFEVFIQGFGNFEEKQYQFGQIELDTWTMITFTWNRSTTLLKVYQDGVEQVPVKVLDETLANMQDNADRRITFGAKGSGAFPEMTCLSGALWDTDLSSDAIVAMYNGDGGGAFDLNFDQGNYQVAANLVHWYRMGHQASPDIFIDYADAGSFQKILDDTNLGNPDIVVDAPPGGQPIVVTLPSAASNDGREITIQDQVGSASGVSIVILAGGGDNIGGSAEDSIDSARGAKTYTSDGSNQWRVQATNTASGAGETGPTGADGVDGATGEIGPTGATGITGAGNTGATGETGTPGPAGVSFAKFDTTHSPIALYQFEDDFTDSSGNGRNLTLDNGVERYTTVGGLRAAYFDGDDRYQSTDAAFRITGDLTVEMLLVSFKSMEFSQNDVIVSQDGGTGDGDDTLNFLYRYTISSVRASNYFAEEAGGTNISFSQNDASVPLGVLTHVVMVRENNDIIFYIDGVQAGAESSSLSAPVGGSATTFNVGNSSDDPAGTHFQGALASLKIIGSALTAQQVLDEYNLTLGNRSVALGPTGEQGETGNTGGGLPGGDTTVSSAVLSLASPITLTNNVSLSVDWDTTLSDPDGWGDVGGSNPERLTVPAGQNIDAVEISAAVSYAFDATGRRFIILLKNGSNAVDGRDMRNSVQAGDALGINLIVNFPRVPATAGDYFEIESRQESGGDLDVTTARTWVQIDGIVTGGVSPGNTGAAGETGVTGPGVAEFSGALVSKASGDQTITTSTDTDVVFDTEVYDVGGWYADGGDETIFTVPAGVTRVRLACNVRMSTPVSTGERRVRILKNDVNIEGTGTLVTNGTGGSVSPQLFVSTGVLEVVEGDEFQVSVFQNAGQDVDVVAAAESTWFSIENVTGVKGDTGATGATGATGETGLTGSIGEAAINVGPDLLAIAFDGSTERLESSAVNVETDIGITNAFTVMCTVKLLRDTNNEYIFEVKEEGTSNNRIELSYLGVNVNEPLITNLYDSAGSQIKAFQYFGEKDLGIWQHLVWTWNGTDTILYKNGVALVADLTPVDTAGTLTNTDRVLRLATKDAGGTELECNFHSSAFWDTALTASEVLQVYDSGLGAAFFNLQADSGAYTSSASLIHWYRLGTNTSVLGEDVQGSLDLVPTDITSADIVNDFPGQTENGATGATGLTGLTGASGSSGETGATGAVSALAVAATGTTATMTTEDAMLVTTGGVTITLPSAATVGSGAVIYIKDRDGNAAGSNITVDGDGSETIDGSLTYVLSTDYQSATFLSDGTNWSLI